MSRLRQVAKEWAPTGVVAFVRWGRSVRADARLRLLTEVGYLPSHRLRNYFYRRAGLSPGDGSSIHWRAEFYNPGGVVVAHHTIVGYSVLFDGRDGVSIGDNVDIGDHVAIYTSQHDIDAAGFGENGGAVLNRNRAYIGSRAIILPGVSVGERGVVAAGAVVTRDGASFTMVAGVPTRLVCDRSRELTFGLGYAKRFV